MSVFRKRSKSDAQTEYSCSIRFLDDSETIQLTFKKDTLGAWLFDRVCEKLNLVEKDYFGLRFVDAENQRHWLDPLKTVYKQLKGLNKMVLCFRVKFYPEDPMKLHEEITRYYLFLQLRRDLHHGRLLCPHDESIQLAAYIIQSEVGDYDPQDHQPGYVSEFKMLPKQTPKHEEKIMEAHSALAGEVPADCEANFLRKAASMDTYGVDPHQVKDQRGDPLYLGVTHLGIMTFRGSRRTQLFKWSQIRRIAYEGKMFIINHSTSEELSITAVHLCFKAIKKHQAIGFKCLTASGAKYLWRCAVEQQLFFTLSSSLTAPKIRSGGGLFSRGSKFRFSGRCQNEAYEASENIRRTEPPFARTSSLPNFGKKSHSNDGKSNTLKENRVSESFREDRRKYNVYLAPGKAKEEAAVDVPNIITNESPVVTPTIEEVVETGPQVKAPLAAVEAFEEKIQLTSSPVIAAAPPVLHKENGQVVKERPAVLETSIDETLPYEPNRTVEDSDEEDNKNKPCLDEQIKMLEEELINPVVQKELNLSPQLVPTVVPEVPKKPKQSSTVCLKVTVLSLVFTLLLFLALFYVVFFSPFKHPLIAKLRANLVFLEPVKDVLVHKTNQLVSYFKK
ncbi:FERM domain-containing protein 5-like isoform X4 [Physella acuta]|uniref:FERM domain-containing protein 5-like isoform X4 n=1 Tax=Physella acuta TaxID=109671 RepID=UPI0027DABCEC|nr:FERM domain-containing protein 5-like isoform X4 [Physella acuta]